VSNPRDPMSLITTFKTELPLTEGTEETTELLDL
jgi:hypothetical protein